MERAETLVKEMERTGSTSIRGDQPTIEKAAAAYLAEEQDRGDRSERTLYYKAGWLERFTAWCTSRNVTDLDELTPTLIREWFGDQTWAPGTRHLARTRLKAWFAFCRRRKWMAGDPTSELPKITPKGRPTLPLSESEFNDLLGAISDPWTKAVVLVLRWSGLRISDCLSLKRDQIDISGRLAVITRKTGERMSLRLPPVVLEALKALPASGSRYFLAPKEDVYYVGRRFHTQLVEAGRRAGVSGRVHAHRLRDSFACGLLEKGIDLDVVQRLLGHRSIKTTSDHYSHWVKSRQEQLDRAIEQAW